MFLHVHVQVIDFNFESGIVDLTVGEATVGSVDLAFIDPKTNSPKTQGATKPHIIRRHLTTQTGHVYSLRQAKQDIDSIYSTGLFEDVNIVPQEAEDSTEQHPKVGRGGQSVWCVWLLVCNTSEPNVLKLASALLCDVVNRLLVVLTSAHDTCTCWKHAMMQRQALCRPSPVLHPQEMIRWQRPSRCRRHALLCVVPVALVSSGGPDCQPCGAQDGGVGSRHRHQCSGAGQRQHAWLCGQLHLQVGTSRTITAGSWGAERRRTTALHLLVTSVILVLPDCTCL